MTETAKQIRQAPMLARAGLALSALLLALCALAPVASANYEQVPEHFGVGGEPEQLFWSRAIAVNIHGTGGVEAGSIYVVGFNRRVLRFSAGSEGEAPQFREAWGWDVGSTAGEFQRCGPAYSAEPRPANAFATCQPGGSAPGGEQVGHFTVLTGVAVDQVTGNVYVLNENSDSPNVREHHLIEVFSATGVPIGEGFGDIGREKPFPSEGIAEGPGKLHEQLSSEQDGIAVDDAGTVYVIDHDFTFAPAPQQTRVMSFEPEIAGNFEHYVYAGQGKDITAPGEATTAIRRIAWVGPGRLVVASRKLIREYSTGGGSSPICSHQVTGGQAIALAANPLTGEVFYYVEGTHSKLFRLGPCDEASGQFAELQQPIIPVPETEQLFALAANPSLHWSPLRPAGVLYGADAQSASAPKGIGDIFVPAVVAPPAVESESVANTTSTSSTLQARIDPQGLAVSFHFEYLSVAEYLANGESFQGANPRVAPLFPGQIGGGGVGLATAEVSGLKPETGYVFRVIAERDGCLGEPICRTAGQSSIFHTYPVTAAGLPDARAYELVSPAQKQGGEVFPADSFISSCLNECKPPGGASFSVFPMQASPGGDAVSYMGYPFSPTEGAAVFNSYISRRTTTGWQTVTMSPRLLSNKSDLVYGEALDEGVLAQETPQLAADAPSGYANLYLQNVDDPAALQPLLTMALFEELESAPHPSSPEPRPYRGPGFLIAEYKGHSPDFSAQYFAANDSLTLTTPYAPEPADTGASGRDLYEWRSGRLTLVNVLPGNTAVAEGSSFVSDAPETNGIADNGRRVFWKAGGHVYMREDNRTTREIHHPAAFLAASPDGLEVLLSDGCLYSLTTTSCSTDLTQGKGGFLGIAGQGRDLSRIYFVDTAALPGKNSEEEEAEPGKPNLYLYESGVGTRFIATLLPTDGAGSISTLNDWATAPGVRTAEASPDGRYLAFGSTSPLTGYGNVGPCNLVPSGTGGNVLVSAPCKEVFLYDSTTDRLTCPSCNPTGEAPLGNSTLRRITRAGAREWLPQPRYLTDQGRLFFDSSDRLSSRDTNGRVEDVYESEPGGVGSCARAGGCVSLISPGTGTVDSNFLAMGGEGGGEGSNVFFTTREELVPIDSDELLDVYDARIAGGFSSETETTRPECQGEACQPSPSPPAETTPASAAFHGAGNLEEGAKTTSRCPRGKRKVKSRGKTRCVAKHKKRHKRHHKRHHRRANADRRAHR